MVLKPLRSLCLRVAAVNPDNTVNSGDVVVIIAEPTVQDLALLLRDPSLVHLVEHSLFVRPQHSPTTVYDTWSINDDRDGGGANGVKYEDDLVAEEDKSLKLEIKCEEPELAGAAVGPLVGGDNNRLLLDENGIDSDSAKDFVDSGTESDEGGAGRRRRQKKGRKRERPGRPNDNDECNKHIETVGASMFKCTVCSKEFNSKNNCRKHVRLHGIGEEPIEERTCPTCHKVYSTKMVCKLHIRRKICVNRASKEPPRCDDCRLELESIDQLRKHRKLVHGEGYQCAYCEYISDNVSCVKSHEKTVHLNLRCKDCYKIFNTEAELAGHPCQPSRFQCDSCDYICNTKQTLMQHIDFKHRGKKERCEKCNVELSAHGSLKRHMRTVHGGEVRKFKCEECGKPFKSKDCLRKHSRVHAISEKGHLCTDCGKEFTKKYLLIQHFSRVHQKAENMKHFCEDCGQGFISTSSMLVHMEFAHHKGEKFMCQECGKEVIGKTRLRKHMASWHPPGQEFVRCEHCGKEVAKTQYKHHVVEAHKMQQYSYQCEHCPKKCPTKQQIKNHYRKHTKARPYSCRACRDTFSLASVARHHMKRLHFEDFTLIEYNAAKDIGNPYV